jgi:3-oxoacyl-[acyl-carrier-protein] synthase III
VTRRAVLAGVGGFLPPKVVTNDDLAAYLETSDEWIRGRTGIATRHWADPGVATSDLAVQAGLLAMRSAGESDVDALVLATTTPDRPCPGTAPDVATRLGLSGIPACDVSTVCSGFLYGLATASGWIATGMARSVLLIGAETYSTILNPKDRNTTVIFGDGAGAVLLRAGDSGDPGEVGPCVLGSDGAQSDLITIPAGGSRQRSRGEQVDPADLYFQMRGRDVYRHAVERMSESATRAVAHAGWSMSEVDRLAPHQANAKISASVAERLGIPQDRVLANIAQVGNTAAASIPLLLAQAAAEGQLSEGHKVVLTAFGGGLTWGAATVSWPDVTGYAVNVDPARQD